MQKDNKREGGPRPGGDRNDRNDKGAPKFNKRAPRKED